MKVSTFISSISLILLTGTSHAYPRPGFGNFGAFPRAGSGNSSAWDAGCSGPATGDINQSSDRSRWTSRFDINTDYENSWPKTGVVRCFDFTISQDTVSPDGYPKLAMLVNGQYPGPPIIVDWGDTIRVRVTNNLTTNGNGTAIHWHGFRLLNNNLMDGVPGTTQCPIPPGGVQVYEFQVTQYGNSWYHSHFGVQAAEGVAGPIIVRGPTSANYDEDLGNFGVADWLHANAFAQAYLDFAGAPPSADSNLLNGKGVYSNCANSDLCDISLTGHTEVDVEKGKTYKMHLVNMGIGTQFTFWIDGHDFTVVSTDFVPIKPYKTDTINLAPGQRYQIILEANGGSLGTNQTDFWINARSCGGVSETSGAENLGIIRYAGGDATPETITDTRGSFGCMDPSMSDLIPVVPKTVGVDKDNSTQINAGRFPYPDMNDTSSKLNSWALGIASLALNWSEPTVKLMDDGSSLPMDYVPVYLDNEGEWSYFVILDNFTDSLALASEPNKNGDIAIPHPIHLHGHDFSILAQSNSTYDPATLRDELNLNNPPRRDVAILPAKGYLVIGFLTDNPGAWLMHCHIAWHANSGMALEFIELQDKVKETMRSGSTTVQNLHQQCDNWLDNFNTYEEGSGI